MIDLPPLVGTDSDTSLTRFGPYPDPELMALLKRPPETQAVVALTPLVV